MRKVVAVVLIVILVIALCAPVFAAEAVAITSAEIFGSLASTYAASRGLEVVTSQNGVASSVTSPMPSDVARSLWNPAYAMYANGIPQAMTIDDWADWASSRVSISVAPAGNVTPTKTTFQLADDLVEWFDNYFTHLLSVELGVPSESGVYHTSGNFFNSTVSQIAASEFSFSWYGVEIPAVDVGTVVASSVNMVVKSLISSAPVFGYCVNNGYYLYFVSSEPFIISVGFGGNNVTPVVNSYNTGTYEFQYAVVDFRPYSYGYTLPNVPLPSGASRLPQVGDPDVIISSSTDSALIQLRPSDKYNEGLKDGTGKTLDKGDVYIPDPTATDYQADTLTGTWSIPYEDAFVGELDQVLAKVKELVNSNDTILELDKTAPDPVSIPFLPPGGLNELPSFDFSLSGIWHYVVSWIGSIRSGAALIASVWSSLPYAMLVPIWASAVIVIVLGMYKRFFM